MRALARAATPFILMAAAAAAEGIRYTPHNAVLGCKARVDHELALQSYAPARPIRRFLVERRPHGWRVEGAYVAREGGAERHFRIGCRIDAGGVALTVLAPAE